MNDLVSSDQRPATSPANTTNLARLRGPTKFGIPAFLAAPRSFQDNPVAICCAPMREPVAVQSGNECGVHCKLNATRKRDAINHNFQPSCVSDWGIPNPGHGRTRSCSLGHLLLFSARCVLLHSPLHNHVLPEPTLRTSCTMVATSQVDGHIANRKDQKKAQTSLEKHATQL